MPGPIALFDLFNNQEEQFMLNGLVEECILIYGLGCYYLPRRTFNIDPLFTEDNQKYFDTVYETTFYIKNVEGFEGQGNFLSKFGLEIRDQITLTGSDTTFMEDVGRQENMVRPLEGDLIYFPLNQKCFQIDFVEKFAMFYPLGSTPSYDLTIKLFEYAGEKFSTGIPQIDIMQQTLSENMYDWAVLTEDGVPILTEDGNFLVPETFNRTNIDVFDQADDIQKESDQIMDFTELDPFSESKW